MAKSSGSRQTRRTPACAESAVSSVMQTKAGAAAEPVFASHERAVLSAADWKAFHDALLDPPEPNAMLRKAAGRYRERFGG